MSLNHLPVVENFGWTDLGIFLTCKFKTYFSKISLSHSHPTPPWVWNEAHGFILPVRDSCCLSNISFCCLGGRHAYGGVIHVERSWLSKHLLCAFACAAYFQGWGFFSLGLPSCVTILWQQPEKSERHHVFQAPPNPLVDWFDYNNVEDLFGKPSYIYI